ncbi:stalk domain-containing protein [Paenibacillus monticola]|uniref:DUF3887 domain-containing protein n=1 Tax=Paenibacillus monticola TaxID=2666075 RepID=A0A7X2H854_9BACL|nr:stalk domain-containing protein [Paenibacillus monticola]MRN55175.1 DUF3887 domain-containing protein [Paenibacillus monticola]
MRRISAFVLSILLLMIGSWIPARTVSSAASNVNVILNGQSLKFEDSAPYFSGSTVMIPLRETAVALKFITSYQKATDTIQLNSIQSTIAFKAGGQDLTNNGVKVTFKENTVVRQDRVYVPLSFFAALGLVTAYDAATNQVEVYTPDVTAGVIVGLLAAGKYQELEDRYFDPVMKRAISIPVIQQTWENIAAPAGNYLGVKTTVSSRNEEGIILQSVLSFSEAEASFEIRLNNSAEITDLRITPLPVKLP